jgi:hypothetical protein
MELDLKLIHEFIEQSRTIMGRHNVQAFERSNVIRFTIQSDMDAASVIGLMAWAFLGRIVSSREQSNKQTVFLQYDIHRNKLLIHRDSCEINKSLYSAMILASVTLLIFFISMMVSDSVRHKMEKQKGMPAKAPNTEKSDAWQRADGTTHGARNSDEQELDFRPTHARNSPRNKTVRVQKNQTEQFRAQSIRASLELRHSEATKQEVTKKLSS